MFRLRGVAVPAAVMPIGAYFKYEFPEGVDSVIVKVTSAMAFPCSVISIQDILCPVYDLDNNVAFIGMYQTMTKKAAITVQKKDFPSNSFYVVVVVKTEDEACGGSLPYYPLSKDASPDEPVDQHNRQKMLEVMVSPAITSEAYVSSVLFCLGIFLSFYVLTVLIACWESCRQQKRKGLLAAMDSPSLDTASLLGHARSIPDSFLGHSPYDSYGYGSFGNGSSSSAEGVTDSLGSTDVSYSYMGQEQFKRRTPSAPMRPLSIPMGERSLENVAGRPRLDSLSSVEEDDYDTLADIDYDKNVIRTKKYLCVADLARKDKRVLRKKYQIYFWNIATIAVFYALPVIQLVITYQTVVNVTGNQDICYYNFLCAHPLGNLSAFNNILSNLGYVLLGLLFLLIILQREINYNRALMRNDTHALVRDGQPLRDSGILRRILHVLYTDCVRQCSGPMYVDRMVLLVMGNIINWSLAAYGLIVRPNDFASYLLAIGICNLLLYFAFYIIMKLRSGERIKLIPLLCIISTSVVWGFALFFFFQGLSTWQKTPAESREHNRDCILLDFFDDHDIWHFLSSIAMFGSFLVLLTLDDDLDCVQRDKIYVF
ncbi:PREDICTED: SID1 transmembrane family member 2 [Chaetura pelagica]|uniref:SID1 transmembrane family member 2 n=1 Tax=Chaetura pelagica TaxID=8897 RepID=UPI000523DF76|nr:PREDICTED: SID1 transmembrane family member 2 [Chaetura pelagica]